MSGGDAWVQLGSGARVDLIRPQLKGQPHLLHDLAIGLARLPRFLGHTAGATPYSVAQHCCVVGHLAAKRHGPEWKLPGLLHDAHEALMGDIPTPVVRALGLMTAGVIGGLKERLDRAICRALVPGLRPQRLWSPKVIEADRLAFAMEWQALMPPGMPPPEGTPPFNREPAVSFIIWPRKEAYRRWRADVEAALAEAG